MRKGKKRKLGKMRRGQVGYVREVRGVKVGEENGSGGVIKAAEVGEVRKN